MLSLDNTIPCLLIVHFLLGGRISNLEFSDVAKLKVQRYAFKDLEVMHRMYLGDVSMDNVVSMAFTLRFVKVSFLIFVFDSHLRCGG